MEQPVKVLKGEDEMLIAANNEFLLSEIILEILGFISCVKNKLNHFQNTLQDNALANIQLPGRLDNINTDVKTHDYKKSPKVMNFTAYADEINLNRLGKCIPPQYSAAGLVFKRFENKIKPHVKKFNTCSSPVSTPGNNYRDLRQ